MIEKTLSTMEIDAIGEILNISLGASATAISTMLDARVDITTPVVRIEKKSNFSFSNLEPAVAVEITYVEGLSGKNVMLLKRNDVKTIVEMLMGTTFDEDEFELNELNISAICEVMNQMMGASATALSELLGETVNISTPESFEIEGEEHFKDLYFTDENAIAVISFKLKIADRLESEFLNLMSIDLAKELVSEFLQNGKEETISDDKQEIDKPDNNFANNDLAQNEGFNVEATIHSDKEQQTIASNNAQTNVQMQANNTPNVQQTAYMDTNVMNQMVQTMQMMQQQMIQMQNDRQNKTISVSSAITTPLKSDANNDESDVNLDLLMSVPLELSVEIGRTKKLVKDILDLNKGTLVVLDRAAGEPVDLYVNGECIAKGDVVVVDDNFGIRITEILQENVYAQEQESE